MEARARPDATAATALRVGRQLPGVTLAALAIVWSVAHPTRGRPADPRDVGRLPLPQRVRLVARVAEPPVVTPARTLLIVAADAVDRGRGFVPASGRVRVVARVAVPTLRRGDLVALETTLRRPRNFDNPGRFDFAAHLARRSIWATASVRDATAIRRLGGPEGGMAAIDAWRACVGDVLEHSRSADTGAVLRALVLGDPGRIATPLRTAFTRAGVVHVLSVSGLHVAIVAGGMAGFLRWVLSRNERMLLVCDVRKLALAGGLGAAAIYGALAGFEVATLRSVVMAGAGVAAALADRRASFGRMLGVAMVVVVLGWPAAPAEISFQLSFGSVLALALWAARCGGFGATGARGRARHVLEASCVAALATGPLTAFHFHQISLVGVVANPVVVPLFGGVVLVPGLLGAAAAPFAPAVAQAIFGTAEWILALGLAVVDVIGAWPWAAVATPLPTAPELVGCYALLAGLWWRHRPLGRIVLAVALGAAAVDLGWHGWDRFASRTLRATFLDVGQGDAAVLELPDGRVLVVDGGGFPGSDFDTGAAVIEPFLRTRWIGGVDAVVMTHAHPDHAGGLAHLVTAFRPAELWWNGEPGMGESWRRLAAAMAATGVASRRLHAGDPIPGFPEVEVLHPPPDGRPRTLNDGSLVLRVLFGSTALLLTGDLERAGEGTLLRSGRPLGAGVLKVPHHGSRTSSGWPFVTAVEPALAVVSVGADNRYGHPAPEVVRRYRSRGTRVLRTDRCGAVTVTATASAPRVETMRPCAGGPLRLVPP